MSSVICQRAVRSLLLTLLLLPMGAALAPPAHAGNRALDEFFKGTVVAVNDGRVTVRYDFRDKEQLKDFEDRVPWPIPRRNEQAIKWFDEKLEVIGNSAARHVAEWTGDVSISVVVTTDHDQDIGGFLTPINGADDFATFSLVEKFFHAWDGSSGGTHSIIKFGKQWRERGSSDDYIGFRYVDRKPPKDPMRAGQTIPITFGIEKGKLVMTSPDVELKGADRGKKLSTFFFGLYVIKGRALFDNLEITGTLNDAWLRQEKLDLRIANLEVAASGDLDPTTKELIAAHQSGGDSKATRQLIAMVGDLGRPRVFREKVIEALKTGPRRTVKYIRDLLYSPELEVRADAIEVVDALMGKDWGYKPKGTEDSRSKAIRKMNEDIDQNPSLLDD